jgi:serine/threonine protein kinase/Tfp pilus assembly protein PilF
MLANRWEKIEQLFNAAVAVPFNQRNEFLEKACGADVDLCFEVAELLEADDCSDEILEQTVFPLVAQLIDDDFSHLLEKSDFASYKLQKVLGRGGMGIVFLAEDTRLERFVALKILSSAVADDAENALRFEHEAKVASAVSHQNVAHIYEFGKYEGRYFFAMEYVPGKNLRQSLEEKKIDLANAVEIALQIARALEAAHNRGIVHRDVKPENVIIRQRAVVTKEMFVKVLDFGLAKLSERKPREGSVSFETKPGLIMGTTAYMSPEQVRGEKVDERTDLWSLGVVLYEMIAGERPFKGETASDVQAAILLQEPTSLPLDAKLSQLNVIVEKALSKNVAARYQSAEEIINDLRSLQRQVYDYLLQSNDEKKPLSFPARLNSRQTDRTNSAADDSGETISRAPEKIVIQPPATPETSSFENFSRRVKNHKLSVGVSVLAVIAISSLAIFSYFSYFARRNTVSSVVVLPFVNATSDPNIEYLSDGISESLINNLSQISGVKVIARSSSFKFKGKEMDVDEVAKALGVEAVVSGKVTQSGDNLLVNVELVDARDKTQIWGERLLIQSAMSREIADKLHIRLTGAQEQLIAKRETKSPEAYELALKSKVYNRKGGNENMKKSLEFLNQAIALDPNYAVAYVNLSIAYRNLVDQSLMEPNEAMPKAESAAYKALELDENSAEAHFALATIKRDAWQWQESEREFRRAIELNPNLSRAHSGYATYLSLVKRHDEAVAEIKLARELDPLSPIVNASVSWTFYLARRYDEALEAIQRGLELDRENPDAHYILGYIYMAKGMLPEAIAEYQETIKYGLDIPGPKIYQGVAFARLGETVRARKILRQLEESREYVSPAELAILYAALDEREQAFASLEKAFAAHDLQLQSLAVDAAFDNLRSEKRFQDLLGRIGLPQ